MNVAERKVLDLLEGGKVTAQEAADLIDSIRSQVDAPLRGRRLASSIVGRGPLHADLHEAIAKSAAADGPVVVEGETGTGKIMISRTIHYNSRRADRPFLLLDCSGDNVEAELFGVEPKKRGDEVKRGLLDVARGGTVALDNIADLSPDTQRKLYTFLQTGQFQRVNGSKTLTSDVRVIGVCHGSLRDRVGKGFSEDLFAALGPETIVAPALRDRREDIPDMVAHFVSAQAHAESRVPPRVSDELIEKLVAYDWPENARELHSVIREAVSSCKSDVLGVDDVAI